MQRTLIAFDFGTQMIGTAVGQEVTATAHPLLTLPARQGSPDWKQIVQLVRQWQPDLLVVGLPLNMDGSVQPMTHLARQFAYNLQQRFSLPVVLQDERLTTIEARARLFAQKGYRALTKKQIDRWSATVILESWFSTQYPLSPSDA